MQKDFKAHWDNAYKKTERTKLGWYEQNAEPTLKLIQKTNLPKNSRILNVGVGSSTLVKSLLNIGYNNLILNDISSTALQKLEKRLGYAEVKYIQDDLTKPNILQTIEKIDLWNDRAVLHFFNKQKEIETYFNLIKKLLLVNGFVILSEFALDGAAKCCGLDVRRYNLEMFKEQLGEDFEIIEQFNYNFYNPNGDERKYIYALFKRIK